MAHQVHLVSRSPDTTESVQRFLRIHAAKERADAKYLIEALRDPDHRMMVAKYLGELGAVEAVERLLPLLDAADPHVRISAAKALGRLRAWKSIPRLREIALHDDCDGVRAWAIGALGEIGDREGVDLVERLLFDPSWRVRAAAALALRRLGDSSAIEPLRRARARLRHSPVEWYLYRRIYNRTIRALERESRRSAKESI